MEFSFLVLVGYLRALSVATAVEGIWEVVPVIAWTDSATPQKFLMTADIGGRCEAGIY
jgi:hypothetical protein